MRPLKRIDLRRSRWQEAFPLHKNLVICPYCGEETRLHRPWGICSIGKVEHTIHNCFHCRMPYVNPRGRRVDERETSALAMQLLRYKNRAEGSLPDRKAG